MYNVIDTSNEIIAVASELRDAIALVTSPLRKDELPLRVVDEAGNTVYPMEENIK
jgi:hypothetical protein|tara:strand:- start:575 stop:739 length:165 start_codon:yes stop_codon:yes gene_type:complete